MRILHVITSLLTGGAEKLVVDLVPKLAEMGHQVDVAVFNATSMPLKMLLTERCPRCKVYELGNSFYSLKYIWELRKITRNYDIVHTHNSSPQLFAALANIGRHKKLVTTEHSTNNRKREHTQFRGLDRWTYRHYNRIICISDIAREKLLSYLRWKQDDDRVVTINNGVDVKAFRTATPVNGQTLGFSRSDRYVTVMVAGFREAKDQDTVVRALALLPEEEYELWLVGVGVRMDEVKELVKTLKLEDRVHFLGLRSDVPNVLKAADVVVMSSHWEGLSLSNVEGMSVGKPFIASNVDGLKEVTEGYGLLFPHEDAQSLANIIKKLHDDKTFYNEIAERCYARAKEYDLNKTVIGYEKVYQECGALANGTN
jgi:glycosyltransferase involved in cell wall biosynthesis